MRNLANSSTVLRSQEACRSSGVGGINTSSLYIKRYVWVSKGWKKRPPKGSVMLCFIPLEKALGVETRVAGLAQSSAELALPFCLQKIQIQYLSAKLHP